MVLLPEPRQTGQGQELGRAGAGQEGEEPDAGRAESDTPGGGGHIEGGGGGGWDGPSGPVSAPSVSHPPSKGRGGQQA